MNYYKRKKGKANKAPDRDGLCQELFRKTWQTSKRDVLTAINHMYIDVLVTDQQKHGIIVCLANT